VRAALAIDAEAEIQFPVGKELMKKVIEFMKHHKGVPCSELRVPLEAGSLEECGASKFDAAFVKAEKDKLFELIVAAAIFDIQGLFMLASAQVSLNLAEKTAQKLCKDLNMNADVSTAEEENVISEVNSSRHRKNMPLFEEGENVVAVNAAVLAGITAAAQKLQISAAQKKEAGLMTLSSKSWHTALWTSAVMMDWRVLGKSPTSVSEDRNVMSTAIALSRGEAFRFASGALTNDKSLILEAVEQNGAALQYAAKSLRADEAFVTEAAMVNGGAMQGAADSLRSDPDFVLKVTNAGLAGSAVNGASKELTSNPDFILNAVVKDPEAFKYASKELASQKTFALNAAARNGLTLKYMSQTLRADKDVVMTAVMENKMAALFAHVSRHADIGALDPGDWVTLGKYAPLVGGTKKIASSSDEGVVFNDAFYFKTEKQVQFSAQSTMTANMGQANYIAANSFLDKLPFFERPEFDSMTIMWGAVGNIGMRWKAFASADFLNATPEGLLQIPDACRVLSYATWMTHVEWANPFFTGSWEQREGWIRPTAGFGSGGGWKPSNEDAIYPIIPKEIPSGEKDVMQPQEQPREPREMEEEPREMEEVPGCPLGGWPGLLQHPDETLAPRLAMPFQEGAHVRLTGLSAHNGREGILIKQTANGKWKVLFNDGSGTALLKSDHLEVITFSEEGEVIPTGLSRNEQRRVEKELADQKAAEAAVAAERAAEAAAAAVKEEKEKHIQKLMEEAITAYF